MSRHHQTSIDDIPEKSVIATYWRLMTTFACRYWFRLFLGVLAGMLVGGTLAAGLRVMDIGINMFESGLITQEQPAAEPSPALIDGQDSQVLEAPAPVPDRKGAQTDREKNKRDDLFRKLNRVFAWCKIDLELSQDSVLTVRIVMLILGIIFAFFFAQAFCEFLNKYLLRWVGNRVVTDIRIAMFNAIERQSMSFFAKNSVGGLLSRCTNDITAVEHVISTSVAELVTAPINIIAAVQFIIVKTRELNLGYQSLMLLVAIPFCIIPIILVSQVLKRYERNVLRRVAGLVAVMQENFSGIHVIKAFHREEHEQSRFMAISEKYFKSLKKAILADTLIQPTMQLSAIALATVFIFICCYYQVSLGTLVVIGLAAHLAYKPLKDLAKINASLQKSAAAAERIFAMLDTDTSLPSPPDPLPISSFHDAIEFQDIVFNYGNEAETVLDHVSFTIRHGQHIAIVGQTGSGKSTLANLLARFYDPTAGRITIDGLDVKDLKVDDFRKMVGIVSQDTFLFNDTIENNIRYGKLEATQEEITAAARKANALEFIQGFPDGFQHLVGERGNLLSGGQKQRLAIARAIIKNPPILILDEATSALDSVTEHLVQDALNNVMQDRTVLAIAHRLSTIKNSDLILVMDQGRIIEAGTHAELYAKNGNYRRLCDIQFSENAEP